MAEEDLAGIKIKDSYEGLLHLSDGGLNTTPGLWGYVKPVYDGQGRKTCLSLSTDTLCVSGIGGGIAIDTTGNSDFGFIDQGVNGNGIGLRANDNQDGTKVCDLYVNHVGNVGIGTESSGTPGQLAIKGDGSTKWGSIAINTGGAGDINWGFIDQGVNGRGIGLRGRGEQNGLQECDLYVTHGGNVGIGTESPGRKLHIVGGMRYEHGTPEVGQVLTCTNTNGNVEWQDTSNGVTAVARFSISGILGIVNINISNNTGFSSIVRNSAGVYTLTFSTARASSTSYTVVATREASNPLEGDVVVRNRTATSFVLHSSNDNASAGDPSGINVIVVG